jgi:phosphatidylglycerophosphatase C
MDMPANGFASEADATTGSHRVVLFDFDGVLVRGDAFTKFMRARYTHAWWRSLPLLVLAPVLAAVALIPRGRRLVVRLVVGWALVGLDAEAYRTMADGFGRVLARDARHFSRAAFMALNRHRQAGDRVLVVTGCEETLARAILDELGLPEIELVASRVRPGRFGPLIAVRNIGREKLRQLALRDVVPEWDVAYSDSLVDLPMLAAAHAAIVVNPRGDMLARARARLGDRVTAVEWY